MKIAVIHSGKSNPYNSSFARHISVSNGRFIVMNASKAIAGNLKIVHEIDERECLASIRLNVTEPRSWSSCIAIVVVMVVVLLVVLVVALLKLQKKNIGFPASATLSQQASDAGLMEEIQELAELTQPEDTSGGDQSAVLNGKLLSSAEMLNVAGLEGDKPRPSTFTQCAAAVKKASRMLGIH
ncbi:uncharacterized protein LOC120388212 isoform X2 [Mauremys reevesii]|nr:uncharacterized protein LOC120388212 isoform X2 [Mauremys reevesii]